MDPQRIYLNIASLLARSALAVNAKVALTNVVALLRAYSAEYTLDSPIRVTSRSRSKGGDVGLALKARKRRLRLYINEKIEDIIRERSVAYTTRN